MNDHCGQCRACVEACPTQAIDESSRTLKADKCISTYTIEIFQDAKAPIGINKGQGTIFGCDICQDVCPWNKFSKPHKEPLFNLSSHKMDLSENQWKEITEETFNRVFKNSPLKRAGYNGLKRNLNYIKSD